jgi:hypothetical protein
MLTYKKGIKNLKALISHQRKIQQTAWDRIHGDLASAVYIKSARASNNRLSAPVSARSLLSKFD